MKRRHSGKADSQSRHWDLVAWDYCRPMAPDTASRGREDYLHGLQERCGRTPRLLDESALGGATVALSSMPLFSTDRLQTVCLL